jgi:glycosyltransferase involved in cell wall biosynthesis
MHFARGSIAASARPRIVFIGSYRDALGARGAGLLDALDAHVELHHVAVDSPLTGAVAAYRQAARAITTQGAEAVHLLDARFAPVGAMLQRRQGVPVSVTVCERDVRGAAPWSRWALRSIAGFDEGFVSDAAVAHTLRERAPNLLVSQVRPAAHELPWPDLSDARRVARALRGVRPGRLVLGVPWPENRNDLRWFRDVVLPQVEARPLCLLIGVESRREARLMLRAVGVQDDFRALGGRLNASLLAAVSRCVDAFVVPSASRQSAPDGGTDLTLALAVSGAPVVADGHADTAVLAHERSGFLVDPGDERGFVTTLNRVLALPAVQRHMLGEAFARFTLADWPWHAAATVYGERFAAMSGHPLIPADLRAAA